jgi:hypothetical protein
MGVGAMRRGRGAGRERGAALVEFAIVLPLIAAFLFGIVEFGLAFSDSIAVRTGTRDGARAAVVLEPGPAGCTAGPDSASLMCLTKDRIGLNKANTRVKIVFPPTTPSHTTPLSGDPIRVCTMYPLRSHTGLFSAILDGRTIKSRVEMRLEKDVPAALIASQDTALPGADWSFCS